MSEKVVVVTGGTGQLGRQCVKAFEGAKWKTIGTGFSRANPPAILKVDLGNAGEVAGLLEEVKPKVVVHCAAERFPDKCDADPEGVKRLNIQASNSLAQECANRDIILIYISTDYVFDGKPGAAPYEADAATNPANFYGETKLAGEQAVLSAWRKSVVFRIPVLYGEVEESKESAVNVLLDMVLNKAGKERVEMDHWSIRYPTNTSDVARVLKDVAERYTAADDIDSLPKVLQFSSEDRMTKYEICQRLSEIAGLSINHIVGNDKEDPSVAVMRPYDCHLSTKALKELNISVDTIPFGVWWQRHLRAFKH
ncbi:RmlD-like substrate binding domain-containing protein [Tuber indicum]|nr:RmlD-like substrate binding domain-containing protein [Tuber indicum]